MSDSIMVYFNNGNRAKLSKKHTIIVQGGCPVATMINGDTVVVNWASVSFIREYHEPKEDLNDAN